MALAMADEQQSGQGAQAKHEEAIFLLGMFLVKELDSEFIVENGLGLFEGDPMFRDIGLCLGGIPFEPDRKYSVLLILVRSRPPYLLKFIYLS